MHLVTSNPNGKPAVYKNMPGMQKPYRWNAPGGVIGGTT
jgi:hypothetical protein